MRINWFNFVAACGVALLIWLGITAIQSRRELDEKYAAWAAKGPLVPNARVVVLIPRSENDTTNAKKTCREVISKMLGLRDVEVVWEFEQPDRYSELKPLCRTISGQLRQEVRDLKEQTERIGRKAESLRDDVRPNLPKCKDTDEQKTLNEIEAILPTCQRQYAAENVNTPGFTRLKQLLMSLPKE